MGKKLKNYFMEEFNKTEEAVYKNLSHFKQDNVILNIKRASGYKDPLADIKLRGDINPQPLDEDDMVEEFTQIKDNADNGISDNIFIDLIQGKQIFGGKTYDLYSTLIKIDVENSERPTYYHMNKGDSLNAWLSIGGENVNAYLLKINEKGEPSIHRLSEIVLISMSDEKIAGKCKEVALMTSFSWLEAKIHSGAVGGLHLNQIKTLLLSDFFKYKASQMQEKTR